MKNNIFLVVHLLIWIIPAVLIIIYGQNVEYFSNKDGSSLFPVLYGTVFNIIVFYGNAYYLLPRFLANHKIIKYLLLLFGLLVGATVFEVLLDLLLINIYLPEREYLLTNVVYGVFFIHLVILLLSFIYRFSVDWLRNQKLKRDLLEQNSASELAILKAQVNPHFLFNTLNNFYSIAQEEGNERLGKSIMKLAGLLRYTVYESDATEVSLSKEIEFIENFIELQKLRFTEEDTIDITFKADSVPGNIYVPPLLFISIVENAFKHGISLNTPSFVNISLSVVENWVYFKVSNSNPPQTLHRVEENSGMGLVNLKKRLGLLYGDEAQLVINQHADNYEVKLSMPAH